MFCSLQTIIHIFSIVISVGTFYAFSLLYNSVCVQCLNLPSNYWVVQRAASSVTYWSVIFLSVVLALIPRFVYHSVYTVMTTFLTSAKGALTILCKASYCWKYLRVGAVWWLIYILEAVCWLMPSLRYWKSFLFGSMYTESMFQTLSRTVASVCE